MKNRRIGVLMGGLSVEREVSFRTGAGVAAALRSLGYTVVELDVDEVGPSLADRGVTFATNSRRGLCVSFVEPVHGIEPTGVLRHPAATVTVFVWPGVA